jgi:hypothetical protein
VTDLDPDPAAADVERPSWGLPIVLGLALLPLGKLVSPAVAAPVGLAFAAIAGGLTASNPLLAGATVAAPVALALTVLGFADSLGRGALVLVAAACLVGVSALAGAAGALVGQGWADAHSDDPEAKARARRGVIILVCAGLFFGGPKAALAVSDERARHRAETLEHRLVAATKASMPFDVFDFEQDPNNPISRAVPEVQIISVPEGADLQAEARWGLSARCVLVEVRGTTVAGRIVDDECGPMVGR